MSRSLRKRTPPERVTPWKPTAAQLQDAIHKTVPDLIAPNLKLLFCGINPGLYTSAIGHHFGRPGNRFWPAVFAGGFSDRLLSPFESSELLKEGYGITNICMRTTARADELTTHELIAGGKKLVRTINKYKPRFAAVLGVSAYRVAMNQPQAVMGRQELKIGNTTLWVLPNPSGLNAHYQASHLAELFQALRKAVEDVKG